MDFFEQANAHLDELSLSERKLFEHVVKNIEEVKTQQVRAFAASCFVSTATVMRFVRKLGFSGYREFRDALQATSGRIASADIPSLMRKGTYGEEYLRNVIESVRVVSPSAIEAFHRALKASSSVCCYGPDLDGDIAYYACEMFANLGFRCVCPLEAFERRSFLEHCVDGDMLFLFSFTGEDDETIDLVEKACLRCRPTVVSITQAGNNTLQGLSDIDFYVFAEKVRYRDCDFTSRISMMALVDLLAYSFIDG